MEGFLPSGFKGVCYSKTHLKWSCGIKTGGKRRHLGFFDDKEEAGRCYDKHAKEAFGEFAVLNFPDDV